MYDFDSRKAQSERQAQAEHNRFQEAVEQANQDRSQSEQQRRQQVTQLIAALDR